MAVDEFGREILISRSRRGGDRDREGSPPSHHPSSPLLRDGGAPSHLYEALPTSRYGRSSGGGDGGTVLGGGGGGGGGYSSSRKRKHRPVDDSPPPPFLRSRGSTTKISSSSSSNQQPHPSTVYAEEPMLCQYLWMEANPDKTEADYDEYRRGYCLNYVRTFFNEHMDDSWFRTMYSPLIHYRAALQERDRAMKEAQQFKLELETSLGKQITSGESCFFVRKARLGGGIKQPRKILGEDYHHHQQQQQQQQNYHSRESPNKKIPSSSATLTTNPVPSSHDISIANQVLPIRDVPPHVTDEQLTMALMNHCTKTKTPSNWIIYSSSPNNDLFRTAFLYAPEEIRKDIITQLNNLDRGAVPATAMGDGISPAAAAHVPRKEDTYVPKELELIVECSDAYGRLEIDADGKGGAPEEGSVPPRKASVWVSTIPLIPNVQVLSAAVSSQERIAKDKEYAIQLAKAYDQRRNVPPECRLEALLEKAFPSPQDTNQDESSSVAQRTEDTLDVAIAYLRRVHLFSFYNGCAVAPNVGDVLSGHHATSTIHLRLANADEILKQAKDPLPPSSIAITAASAPATGESVPNEIAESPPKLDLLVQRLNDAIQKALNECHTWETTADGTISPYVVSKEIDEQAREIEHQESLVEGGWIDDHALIDEDGRARCSFHFCRKLFKDSSFLQKHLMKKHSEFLRAEIAKCHDSYMMKAWDAEEQRPVPPILVDCGRAFSLVPSPVLGADAPIAADPEPDLWRRQEERRKQEEEEEAARRERYNQAVEASLDGPLQEDRPPPRSMNTGSGGGGGFVDVDDMKEEKVEMSFDNVELPIQPLAKKKKKRKLL